MKCSSQELKELFLASCRHGSCSGHASRIVTGAVCWEVLEPVALTLGWKNCNEN